MEQIVSIALKSNHASGVERNFGLLGKSGVPLLAGRKPTGNENH